MADPSRMHARVISERLQAVLGIPPAGIPVYLGGVQGVKDADLKYPYLVVWASPGRRERDALGGHSGQITTRTRVIGVGSSDDEALAVLDRAGAALHCWTPTLAGRNWGLCTQGDEMPEFADKDPTATTPTGRPIWEAGLWFELSSTDA